MRIRGNFQVPDPPPRYYDSRWAANWKRIFAGFLNSLKGDLDQEGKLWTSGGRSEKPVVVTTATYQILATDHVISVSYNGVCALTLPAAPFLGDVYIVQDQSGALGLGNKITVTGGAKNINGQSSTIDIINPYVRLTFRYNGSQWIGAMG